MALSKCICVVQFFYQITNTNKRIHKMENCIHYKVEKYFELLVYSDFETAKTFTSGTGL